MISGTKNVIEKPGFAENYSTSAIQERLPSTVNYGRKLRRVTLKKLLTVETRSSRPLFAIDNYFWSTINYTVYQPSTTKCSKISCPPEKLIDAFYLLKDYIS